MNITKILMAPADASAPAAPAAPASPEPGMPQNFDSQNNSLASLEEGFRKATSDAPKPKLKGRDAPPPNAPMMKVPGPDNPTLPEKEEPKAEPAKEEPTQIDDPFDDPKPKPQEKPPEKAPEKGSKEQNLRVLATERDQLRQEVASLKAELEKRKDYEDLSKSYNDTKKRFEEHENELRVTRYESSAEYKEKWLKPTEDAYKKAVKSLAEFQVEIPGNPELGEESKFRQATEQDFIQLYHLPEGQAWREARKMFGDAAPAIMGHRQTLKSLQEGAANAKAEYQQRGAQLEAERKAQERVRQEESLRLWEDANKGIVEKLPSLLKEQPNDKEFNDTLAAAREIVDVAYSERRNQLTPQERVSLDAKIRNSAIAFRTQALTLKRANTELAQLREKLKKYEAGEPGKPTSSRQQIETEPKTLEEHFFQKTK
jgi:hypothetical protein